MDDAQPQQIALDLSRQHFSVQRGPVLMIGTWVQRQGSWEPCLCFVRAFDPPEAWLPNLITQDAAWVFNVPHGDPVRAAALLGAMLPRLRLTEDAKSMRLLVGLIHDRLDDFLRIPFLARVDRPKGDALGEVTVTDRATGKTVTEVVVDV